MKLFVANCTHQRQDVNYRIPETPGIRKQTIEIGRQIQISGDLNQKQVDAIIEQLRPFGLVMVDEIDRSKPFMGLCASVAGQVSLEKLRRAISHNHDVLVERGREQREEAALVIHDQTERSSQGMQVAATEAIITEEKGGTVGEHALLNEGTRVDRNAEDRGPRKNRRR